MTTRAARQLWVLPTLGTLLAAAFAPVLWAQPAHEHGATATPADASHASEAQHLMLEDPLNRMVRVDRLEARDGDAAAWDLDAWVGYDLNKLWVRSEGDRDHGTTREAEVEVLWAHAFARWWDLVAGARHDFRPDPDQSWAAVGVQGLAPYRFDVEATAFIADGGRAAARVEAQYDLLITQRLVLQPLVEALWYSESDPERGIGTGLSSAEVGLRLRYEVRREVAPYIGLVWQKKHGETADLARANGVDTDDTALVAGVRIWF
jgi:copper resistance protein B